ncbi:MAG: hypothetical protein V2J24_16735 [Pseudomonadales bacterium]|nr:hypothetical protein [Pseudomonadales bacterium]
MDVKAHWLSGRPMQALLCFEDLEGDAFTVCAAGPASEALARSTEQGHGLSLPEIARQLAAPLFRGAAPVPLQPVRVKKAWGEEVWFTGIEARGVVGAGTAAAAVPLPWLLAARPDAYGGGAPILVKVLAASAETGDLYFEVHREKDEVYVVIDVHPDAWPDGRARMRYGFNPQLQAKLGERAFRAAFERTARADARALRALADDHGGEHPSPRAAYLSSACGTRARLERFTNLRGLQPGDVVRVPAGLPHGLMRGVRVIEFQTPSYERRVLYANQPLAPEDGLALGDALSDVRMDVPADPRPAVTATAPGVRAACIARTREFHVHRFELRAGATTPLPRARYGVLVGASGSPVCAGTLLAPEQAALLSGEALLQPLQAGKEDAVVLLAIPKGCS